MKKTNQSRDRKVVVLVTGGSGGHIFPAIDLAKDLQNRVEPLFLGVGLNSNRFLSRIVWRKIEVKGSSFSMKNLFRWAFFSLFGLIDSIKIYKKENVSCVVGFGSFYSFPSMLAARFLRIPYFIYEPNRITGRVNRLFSAHAQENCVLFTEIDRGIKGKKRLIDIKRRRTNKSREEILESLGFSTKKRTLFVMGGSNGSTVLNHKIISMPIDPDKYQLIHLVGKGDEIVLVRDNYEQRSIDAYVIEFSDKNEEYWSVADLFIGSSGAGAISESMFYGVAALWIPISHSLEDHQKANALYAEQKIGSGIMIEENAFDPKKVYRKIDMLFDSRKLEYFRTKIEQYKNNYKREQFSDIIKEYL